ncbi:MAG: histidinol-phosphate transaminase [Clostridia bacterium]|nr:histidinol-phosphate transaminase [Clostridia bacterium]
MSKFLAQKLNTLKPYVPGEQPKDAQYIKLNTNENPYSPSKYSVDAIDREQIEKLKLYSDPESFNLRTAIANYYNVNLQNIIVGNGSDEILAFIFAAYGECGVVFPDITYGFYRVFANLYGVKYDAIPLTDDYKIDVNDYEKANKTVIIANPNAQTGDYLTLIQIEELLKNNRENVVVIDEAYIDFGGESAVKLIDKYENLIVVQTFSKSRSLAGARVGFAVASSALIADLNAVKNSFNPYNVNRLSALLAEKAIKDKEYFIQNCNKIIATRKRLVENLKSLGFFVIPSKANFIMTKTEKISGERLYLQLKERGVLVRYFSDERIKNFVRITIGTDEQTNILIAKIKEIIGE